MFTRTSNQRYVGTRKREEPTKQKRVLYLAQRARVNISGYVNGLEIDESLFGIDSAHVYISLVLTVTLSSESSPPFLRGVVGVLGPLPSSSANRGQPSN